jgi:acyl dehydratase
VAPPRSATLGGAALSGIEATMTALSLAVGQKARRSLQLTRVEVDAYARITGDYNPLHFDERFAAATRFGRLVVHGGLTAGILNALVAEDLPGPGSVFMNQNLKYLAPVFIGDTIIGEVEVLSVHESKPVTQLRATVTRDGGEVVLEGECWVYTLRPAQAP